MSRTSRTNVVTRAWKRAACAAGALAVIALVATACSDSATNSSGLNGDNGGGGGGGNGSGDDSGGGGGGGGDGSSGFDAAPPPPPPTCAAGDLLTQTQCGGGLACDIDRTASATQGDGGIADAALDAKKEGGGGGGDGGGGGGGDGGHKDGGDAGDAGSSGPPPEPVVCRKATTTGTEAVACSAADPTTCAAGFTCGSVDKSPLTDARCNKFCDSDSQCGTPGGMCHSIALSGSTGTFDAKVCSLDCDPLTATKCATGQNCSLAINDDKTRLYTDCVHAGAGDHLAACTDSADCKANFSCAKVSIGGNAPTKVCLQTCTRTPTLSACAAGRACKPIGTPNTLGGKEYGFCY